MSAHIDRAKDRHRLAMSQAYAIGSLCSVGFNNPKKFPKSDEFLKEKTRRVVTSLDEQRAVLGRFQRVN